MKINCMNMNTNSEGMLSCEPVLSMHFARSMKICMMMLGNLGIYPGIQFWLSCTPGQFLMGAKLVIGTHWMRNEVVLKNIWYWLCRKCRVCDVLLWVFLLSNWYPWSGVVLDCIDSWSLPSVVLSWQPPIWFSRIGAGLQIQSFPGFYLS